MLHLHVSRSLYQFQVHGRATRPNGTTFYHAIGNSTFAPTEINFSGFLGCLEKQETGIRNRNGNGNRNRNRNRNRKRQRQRQRQQNRNSNRNRDFKIVDYFVDYGWLRRLGMCHATKISMRWHCRASETVCFPAISRGGEDGKNHSH